MGGFCAFKAALFFVGATWLLFLLYELTARFHSFIHTSQHIIKLIQRLSAHLGFQLLFHPLNSPLISLLVALSQPPAFFCGIEQGSAAIFRRFSFFYHKF